MKNIIKYITDHPIRHIVQNTLLSLPLMSKIQMAISTTGAMNRPEPIVIWAKAVDRAATTCGNGIKEARLAEIGVGHSLGVAVLLLLRGAAEVIAIDIKAYADPDDLDQFTPIIDRARETGFLDKDTPVNMREVMRRIKYSIVKSDNGWPLDADSIDIVYSFFSGEHLRSVGKTLKEVYRALKPNGLCMFAVDLRDHCYADDWRRFLYYEPWAWEAMTSRRGKWTNRLMAPQWKKEFEDLFEVLTFDAAKQPVPPGFDRAKLASPFRDYDNETLAISNLWIVARKTGG